MKHTKEPWIIDPEGIKPDNDGIATIVIFCPDGPYHGRTAMAYAECGREDELESNAHLIAEAPAMLRRLESAARWVGKLAADNDTNYIGERAHQELERITAVIAKAKGE